MIFNATWVGLSVGTDEDISVFLQVLGKVVWGGWNCSLHHKEREGTLPQIKLVWLKKKLITLWYLTTIITRSQVRLKLFFETESAAISAMSIFSTVLGVCSSTEDRFLWLPWHLIRSLTHTHTHPFEIPSAKGCHSFTVTPLQCPSDPIMMRINISGMWYKGWLWFFNKASGQRILSTSWWSLSAQSGNLNSYLKSQSHDQQYIIL